MEIRLLVEQGCRIHDSSVSRASIRAQLLEEGFVIVMDHGRFSGLLTPVDLLRSEGDALGKCLSDKPRVEEDDDVAEVLDRMAEAHTDVLPVFRGEAFVGIVRRQRIARHLQERSRQLEEAGRGEKGGAEAARKECESHFRELAELLPQTVFEFDSQGYFTFANRCALEAFGYRAEEIAGLHVCQVFVPEERNRILANIRKKLAAESFDDHEYTALRKDGSTFPSLIYSSAIMREGRMVGVRGIVVDISSRKEWEHALRTSERRYRLLIETAQDGICVFDPFGRLVEVNESFCRICGYSPQELRRMGIHDLEAIESSEQTLSHIQRIGSSGTDRFETKHRRKDGTLIDVEVAATLLDPQEGRFVMFVRDITERRQIEARVKERETTLLHAARLSTLGEMASGIAHELNQPLSAILTYGDACLCLAQVQTPDIPRIARNLAEIISQGERAGVIIRRMRALAKGRQPSFSCADLNDAVRNAVALIRWELTQNGMQLGLELMATLPPVFADPIQIEQVLVNLMRNAVDAMRRVPEGPRLLTLRTKVADDAHVCVEICDTGVGLPQTQAERIFEPFFTTKPDGLGIGLSISRTIIEAHKGVLGARPNTDRGAVFFFSLPVYSSVNR